MINKNKIVDSMLVLQFRTGNKKALGLLVKRWHKKLCRQAYWYTKDMSAAKDIVQDSWSVIIKKLHTLKEPRNFGSWALTIVTRKTMDHLRKHNKEAQHRVQYASDTLENNEQIVSGESDTLLHLMRTSIKALPKSSQQVLHLFYLEELSIRQIGELLGVPVGTIKSRLFNAREKLKTVIKYQNHET